MRDDEQLSKNFRRSEFACKCGCGKADVNPKLVAILQRIRDCYGKVIVLSGVRCEAHNEAVGGAKASQHLLGNAADIKLPGVPAKALYNTLEHRFGDWIGGMGLYADFVHVDVRDERARWNNT